ncbi:MAG: hypothetical protein ACQESG_05795 [Nanobdellota archaeon]
MILFKTIDSSLDELIDCQTLKSWFKVGHCDCLFWWVHSIAFFINQEEQKEGFGIQAEMFHYHK